MKVAIMQPYIFPYIGYFQLINAVDTFIVYDDVNFIKQGWINKNNILANKKSLSFVVPLENVSSFKKINETNINKKLYDKWKVSFFKTIEQNYKKAPYYTDVILMINGVLNSECEKISSLAVKSLIEISKYLNLKTKFIESTTIYNNQNLKGQDRVIDICLLQNARHYINPIGGVKLYNRQEFEAAKLKLNFINSSPITYAQLDNDFVPWLSIIDVLMFNSIDETKKLLSRYDLQ